MPSTPRKYRLLKDLPGCPKGTVFARLNDGPYPPFHIGGFMYGPEGADSHESDLHLPETSIEDRDWFAPITAPERPYPFLPREDYDEEWGNIICYVPLPTLKSPMSIEYGEHGNAEENYALYRTKEDAELALKGLPLYNKAVQALLNRDALPSPQNGHVVYFVMQQDRSYVSGTRANVVNHWYHDLPEHKDGDAGDFAAGVYFQGYEDAKCVSDLFNFFLSNPPSNGG